MRKILIAVSAAVLAVIVAGTANFWIRERSQVALAQAVAQIRSALGPGSVFTFAFAAVHPFSRSAEVGQVVMQRSGERITAERLTVTIAGGNVSSLHAVDLRLIEAAWPGSLVTMSDLDATAIRPLAARGGPFDPTALRIGRLRIHGLTVRTSGGSVNVGTIELDHYGPGERSTLIIRGFSAFLDHAGVATRIVFTGAAASGIDLATDLARSHPAFDIEPGGSRATIDRLSITSPSFALAIARMSVARSASADRIDGGMVLDDFRFRSPGLAALNSIGLDDLAGSLAEHVSVDIPAHTLDLSPARLVLAGLGGLDLRLRLGQVDLAAFSGRLSAAEIVRIAGGSQLVSLHLALYDRGLLDRLALLSSRRSGLTPRQAREEAAARIGGDPSFNAVAGADRIRSPLASFVAHGGTIDLDLHPPAPVSALAVAEIARVDPAGALGQLGLTLTAGSGQEP